MSNTFWKTIDAQLTELGVATSASDVVAVLAPDRSPYGELTMSSAPAFFAGGGGDIRPDTPLRKVGWHYLWYEASYYWAMRAPDGTAITYIEGDIYDVDTKAAQAA